jgi:hypothetical protein
MTALEKINITFFSFFIIPFFIFNNNHHMNIRAFSRKLYKSSSVFIEGGVGCIEELSADEVDGMGGSV